MSKTTLSTSASVNSLPEGIPARLVDSVVRAFAERASVHVARTRAIGALTARGISVRGIVPLVSAYTGGAVPSGFSKSNVSRYAQVAEAIRRDDVVSAMGERPTGTDGKAYDETVQAIVSDLFRIAGDNGGAEDVKRAAGLAGKADGVEAVALAIAGVKAEVVARTYTEATRPAIESNRPTGGETADGGKAPANTEPTPEVAPVKADAVPEHTVAEVLSAASVSVLIAELSRRFKGRAATVAGADVDALSALISRVSSLIEADKVTR